MSDKSLYKIKANYVYFLCDFSYDWEYLIDFYFNWSSEEAILFQLRSEKSNENLNRILRFKILYKI